MLRWRLLLGTVLIASLVALIWLDARLPGRFLVPLALVAATLAAGEVQQLVASRQSRPLPWFVYAGTLLVVAAAGAAHFLPGAITGAVLRPSPWPLLAMAVVVIVALGCEVFRYDGTKGSAGDAALNVFAVAYVGLLFGVLIQLRFVVDQTWGLVALVSLLVVVKMGDVGAYFVGRLIGRHKLVPKLSPGKTIEGVVGGMIFSAFSSLLFFELIPLAGYILDPAPLKALLYGLVLGGFGILGDLAESMLKREAGVKDSSRWLPGFGGVLDLLDSLLVAGPVAYLFWVAGWIGPALSR